MRHRAHLALAERQARSQLTRLVHDHSLLAGSLVLMRRSCGRENCRCTRGRKHAGLYLAIRLGRKRKLIYVPSSLAQEASQGVGNYRRGRQLTAIVSQHCLERFLRQKAERTLGGRRKPCSRAS